MHRLYIGAERLQITDRSLNFLTVGNDQEIKAVLRELLRQFVAYAVRRAGYDSKLPRRC